MSSSGKISCLVALLFAACVSAAHPHEKVAVGAPQEQNMFDMPFPQVGSVNPSVGGSAFGSVMDSSSSSESSEMGSDVDMDTDADGGAATGAAGGATPASNQANVVRGRFNGQVPLVFGGRNQFNRQEPNQPMFGRKSTSGQSVGIAFAVIGLVGLAVASALYAVRKYRERIPVVRV